LKVLTDTLEHLSPSIFACTVPAMKTAAGFKQMKNPVINLQE
jgi:hypothetical protein